LITLTATRIDSRGRCQFRIEDSGKPRLTQDPVTAAKILSRLGVRDPCSIVDHVREWGAVEIVVAGDQSD
jgi:hypothetical protein